jgi:hypothetical protein
VYVADGVQVDQYKFVEGVHHSVVVVGEGVHQTLDVVEGVQSRDSL